jgi:hypothetical protein
VLSIGPRSAIGIGTGKAAGHFAATEGEVFSDRFSVLPSDQLTAPSPVRHE